jgi:hypothetical protein
MIRRGLRVLGASVSRVATNRPLAPVGVRSIAGLASLNSRAIGRLKPQAVRFMGK